MSSRILNGFSHSIPAEDAEEIAERNGYDVFLDRGLEDEILDGRRDLRELESFAIDPEGAGERDDALSVREERGVDGGLEGYRALVHVADVSGQVREGGILDAYARDNGRTFYYGGGQDHMFPEDIVPWMSFEEGEDRLANTVEMSFDSDGNLLDYEIYRSVVSVDHHFTYEEANQLIQAYSEASDIDRRLNEKGLKDERFEFDTPEHQVRSSRLSQRMREASEKLENLKWLATRMADARTDSYVHSRPPAYLTVEEFMVKANHLGAKELASKGRGIFRVHGQPGEGWRERVMEHWNGGDEAFVYPAVAEGSMEKIAEDPLTPFNKEAENRMKAYYSPLPRDHKGLKLDSYAPLTAPIRRYPDVVNWRIIQDESEKGYAELENVIYEMNNTFQPSLFPDEILEEDSISVFDPEFR